MYPARSPTAALTLETGESLNTLDCYKCACLALTITISMKGRGVKRTKILKITLSTVDGEVSISLRDNVRLGDWTRLLAFDGMAENVRGGNRTNQANINRVTLF